MVVSRLAVLAPPPLQGGDHPVASLIRGVRQGALSKAEVSSALNLLPAMDGGGRGATEAHPIGMGWGAIGGDTTLNTDTAKHNTEAAAPEAALADRTGGDKVSTTLLLDQLVSAHPDNDIAAANAWRAAVTAGLLPRPTVPPPHFAEIIARRPLLPRKFTPDATVVAHVHARVAEASNNDICGADTVGTLGENSSRSVGSGGGSLHASWRSELNAVDELNVANALTVCDALGSNSDAGRDFNPTAAPAAWLGGMHNGSDLVMITGWVQGRRRFGGGAALLDLCDTYAGTLTAPQDEESSQAVGACARNATALGLHWSSRLRCVLHPSLFHTAEENSIGKSTSSSSSAIGDSTNGDDITTAPTASSGDNKNRGNNNGGSIDMQKRRSHYAGSAPVSATSTSSNSSDMQAPSTAVLSAYSEVCAPGARVRLWGVLAAGEKSASRERSSSSSSGSGEGFKSDKEKSSDSSSGGGSSSSSGGSSSRITGTVPATATAEGSKGEDEVASERRLWVVGAELLQASWQPKSVGRLLEMVDCGAVGEAEARAALNFVDDDDDDNDDDDNQEAMRGRDLSTSSLSSPSSSSKAMAAALFGPNIDAKTRAWHVRDLSMQLQSSATRMGTLRSGDALALADTASLRARWPVHQQQQQLDEQQQQQQLDERQQEQQQQFTGALPQVSSVGMATSEDESNEATDEAGTSEPSSSSISDTSSSSFASNSSVWGPQRRGVWFNSKKQPQVCSLEARDGPY